MIKVKRALLSVYDKTGIVPFAQSLTGCGIEILSTGGTARALQAAGVPVTPLETLTEFADLFAGRVKTLTPQVHGGLLMRRDREEDRAQAEAHGIAPIDLVCVNLYPFRETARARGDDRAACVEMIDIGGPAMLRAAAKNHAHVVIVSQPSHYESVSRALEEHDGAVPEALAAELAAEVFSQTGAYDAAIFRYLYAQAELPRYWATGGERMQPLRYGENPNQQAACFRTGDAFWSEFEQLQGKELSYNNLGDLWATWTCLREFAGGGTAACVVVKHATPCGVALAPDVATAFARARDGDSLSAFGGVVLLNRPADRAVAEAMGAMFLEVVGAPQWPEDALAALKKKKNLRILRLPALSGPPAGPAGSEGSAGSAGASPGECAAIRGGATWAYKSIGEAVLVQSPMPPHEGTGAWACVTEQAADEATLAELDFAWRVCRHVRSNAIVLTKDRQTIGLGGGQTSRIDAMEVALLKARRCEHDPRGAVLASDAFFPFRDVVDRAAAAGVRAVVQPGGSVRDKDSIAACNEHGVAMYFTGTRVFMH